MRDGIVVLDAGPSSLSFSIFQVIGNEPSVLARGRFDGLGKVARFEAKNRRGALLAHTDVDSASDGAGHSVAIAHLVQWIGEEFGDVTQTAAVGHHVAHGGLEFAGPTLLDDDVIARLGRLVPLAPLRQPYCLAAVEAVRALRPDLPQVACFDTGFHRGRSAVSQRFGLPNELYERGMRRWGFQGLAFESVVGRLRQISPDVAAGRVIVAHLGDDCASMCAVRGGISVDTTTSFSTLDGLPDGMRCGSLDPSVVLFLLKSRNTQEVESILSEESGMLGISGISGDVRELLASASPRAAEAVEFFVYRAVREIGSLTAAMGGFDALVFTAGIGETCPGIRQHICRALGWLGVTLEQCANERGRGCVSPAGRSPSVWVIPTEEDHVIATGTWAAIRAWTVALSRPPSPTRSAR